MKTSEHVAQARINHHKALASLYRGATSQPSESLGLKMWRNLRRIEGEASRAATAQCNGSDFEGQPYRNDEEWENFKNQVQRKVARVFGGTPPAGFFVNGDPRGYALKIESSTLPSGLVTDWGRYGILAPTID